MGIRRGDSFSSRTIIVAFFRIITIIWTMMDMVDILKLVKKNPKTVISITIGGFISLLCFFFIEIPSTDTLLKLKCSHQHKKCIYEIQVNGISFFNLGNKKVLRKTVDISTEQIVQGNEICDSRPGYTMVTSIHDRIGLNINRLRNDIQGTEYWMELRLHGHKKRLRCSKSKSYDSLQKESEVLYDFIKGKTQVLQLKCEDKG